MLWAYWTQLGSERQDTQPVFNGFGDSLPIRSSFHQKARLNIEVMMIITKAYLFRFQTPRGGWTKSQFSALGIPWPPSKGWVSRVVGREISHEAAKIFEERRDANYSKRLYKAAGIDDSARRRKAEKKAKKDKANLAKIRRYKEEHGLKDYMKPSKCKTIVANPKKKITKKTKRKQRKDETFYASKEWRKLRYQAFKIHGRQCQCCGGMPPDVQLHVDHIKPRSRYPSLELDIDNLQILCKDCNLGKSNTDTIDYRTKAVPDDIKAGMNHMKDI